MSKLSFFCVISLSLGACATNEADGTELPACNDEGLTMMGAIVRATPSASTFTVGGQIIGVAGFDATGAKSYAFTVRDTLTASLGQLGAHDVAAEPLKFLEAARDADCQQPDACEGFIAQGGTVDVTSLAPLRATFTLTSLVEANDAIDTLGAAIAGSVTGCLFAPE